MINIEIGTVVLFFATIIIDFPQNNVYLLILIVGMLFNGIIRVLDGIRTSLPRKSQLMFRIGNRVICIVLSEIILTNQQFGILLMMVGDGLSARHSTDGNNLCRN
jgi:hypothetical protein